MSGNSVVAARLRDHGGRLRIRRLHGLEAMRLQGWDLPLWWQGKSPMTAEKPEVTCDFLANLAGNMWSSFNYCPVAIATFGCLPLGQLIEANRVAQSRRSAVPQALDWSPADDSDSELDFPPSE